jgi:dTDP-3-amino-3,4,6-trideoxy-alpha-D-glucose transaminase
VTTSDPEVAARVRRLRYHGSTDKRVFTEVGYNSRLDELQAAGLRVLMQHLSDWNEKRRLIARAYLDAGLDELLGVQAEPEGGESCRHLFAITTAERDRLAASLDEAGVASRPYYEIPLYRQPALERWAPAEPLPETERVCAEVLALPMGPALELAAVSRVVDAVRQDLAASPSAESRRI